MAKLRQTYLMTANLEQSVEFYTTVVGLNVDEHGENSVEFETGESTLKVEIDHDEETLNEFGLVPPGEDRGRGVVIVLEVEDVNAVFERASDYDASEVLSPPRTTSWGDYISLIRDPDGYIIEVSRPG